MGDSQYTRKVQIQRFLPPGGQVNNKWSSRNINPINTQSRDLWRTCTRRHDLKWNGIRDMEEDWCNYQLYLSDNRLSISDCILNFQLHNGAKNNPHLWWSSSVVHAVQWEMMTIFILARFNIILFYIKNSKNSNHDARAI